MLFTFECNLRPDSLGWVFGFASLLFSFPFFLFFSLLEKCQGLVEVDGSWLPFSCFFCEILACLNVYKVIVIVQMLEEANLGVQ